MLADKNNLTFDTETNELTIMEEHSWITPYFTDFKKRMVNLFGYDFKELPCSLAFQFIGEKNINQG